METMSSPADYRSEEEQMSKAGDESGKLSVPGTEERPVPEETARSSEFNESPKIEVEAVLL